MKKRLALLLGVLLIISTIFVACAQTAATERYARWKEGESYTFKIALADFAADGSAFNSYKRKIKQKDSDGNEKEVDVTCYRDNVITSTEYTVLSGGDQLCPKDAMGTYKLNIVKDTSTTRKLVTDQVIYSQYETNKLQELDCLGKLSACIVSADENPFASNEGRTTLRSETHTEVIFANDSTQLPKSAVMENKGFYIGSLYQGPSNYKYETTYDFTNGKVSVKKDNGAAEERKLDLAKGGSCIDAAQLILYVRSLDKSNSAFADTPSVSVYDVTTDSISSASFGINREAYTILNNNGVEAVAKLDLISSTVGGIPFMSQYNLPDLTSVSGSAYDYLPISGDKRCKYTTVKFRCGWYSYEIEATDEIQNALDAIKLEVVA